MTTTEIMPGVHAELLYRDPTPFRGVVLIDIWIIGNLYSAQAVRYKQNCATKEMEVVKIGPVLESAERLPDIMLAVMESVKGSKHDVVFLKHGD